jgi:hypothetical protein
MLKKYLIYFYLVIYAVISGCSAGGGNNVSQSPAPSNSAEVQIGNITTIPSNNSSSGEYSTIIINNNANSDISLQRTQVNANGLNQDATIVSSSIDLSDCLHIGTGKSCRAKVLTNPAFQSYLLSLTFSDSTGKEYIASQIISTNDSLPVQTGFIYDATQLSMVGKKELSIPFRLTDNYTKVNVTINDNPIEFSCFQNKYKVHTLCTAVIKNTELTGETTQIKILGYNGSEEKSSILALGNSQGANIITSGQNVVINPDDGSNKQTIFLVNNGVVNATNIRITPQTPVTIESVTCTSTLAPNAICSFAVNVTGSILSGQSSVNISYLDGQNTQALNFNVSYINQVSPALTLTQSGNFNNIVESTGPIFVSVNVKNSGNTDFTNLQFNNLNLQNSSMSSFTAGSSCTNGQSLGVGQSCVMVLSYSPLEAQSGTVNFIPTATYLGPGGQTLTYTNSILNLAYSSITSASFVAVGDYGTTLSSTAATTPTWSANIDSPFATNSIIANGIVFTGSTAAVMLSTGVVKSGTRNGLFWTTAGTTNFSASLCGIVYDGENYYTCGTSSLTAGQCVSGRGCIERNSSLTGTWTTLANPGSAILTNNIYYFTNGTNKAYFAAIASTTSNGGILASTTGDAGSFIIPNTGLLGVNSNVTSAVYNTNIGNVTAFTSTGVQTSVPLNSPGITGSWTSSTNAPQSSRIKAAIYNSGKYTVGNNAGNIFTGVWFGGDVRLFAQDYTGTSLINGITFGNNTYLAASAGGPIVMISGGAWAIDASSTSNYNSANFDGSSFWLTGTNAIYTSPVAPASASNPWRAPALLSITKNGSQYLAIDRNGNIYSSPNLTAWTQQTNPSGKKLSSIYCVSTDLCLAVGESGTILKKLNGSTWQTLASGATTNTTLKAIACQAGLCVAVGGTGAANSGTVLTSTDYTNWTVQNTNLATTNLNDVKFIINQFYTVGNAGALFVSTNGINWASRNPGAGTSNLNSIDGGLIKATGVLNIVIVGEAGRIVSSTNGGTLWGVRTSNTSNTLNSVIYNGTFVAVGLNGTIDQSSNSTTWSLATFPATSSNTTALYSVISN